MFLLSLAAELLTEGALALLELAKKSNATSPVEAQPQQPQKSVYLVGASSILVILQRCSMTSTTR